MTNDNQPHQPAPVAPQGPHDVAGAGKALALALLSLFSVIGKSIADLLSTVLSKLSNSVQGLLKNLLKGKPQTLTRCSNGHYFDPLKTSECPLCNPQAVETSLKNPERKTPGMLNAIKHTVGIMLREQGIDPTVGWVVCIAGPERGRDYRIRSERNSIGRSSQMQISINDESISRENHATIIFNPLKSSFKLQAGEGRSLVYVNGEEVLQPLELKNGDRIKLGATELLFVPFVGAFHNWG